MLKKDQSWLLKGNYNYDKIEGNLERGKQADIMVISIMLVQVPPGPVPKPS